MSKLKALASIIEQISGHNDDITISALCEAIYEADYCESVNCDDCPFNNHQNMDEAATELDTKL
jgi:hypothetical protein